MTKRYVNPNKRVKKVKFKITPLSGLDTETVHGYAIILATQERAWEAHSFNECVDPLFSDIKHYKISRRFMMYNMKYDAQAILKYLPVENLEELIECNNTVFENYHIIYVQDKFIRITKGSGKNGVGLSGYDIAQFYDRKHLDDVAEELLNERKVNNEVTKHITTDSYLYSDEELTKYFKEHQHEIMRYCIQDATLTQKLGLYLKDKIYEMYEYNPREYISKTMIGKRFISKTVGKRYPQFLHESVVGKMAKWSYHGGIFDCKKRGTFGEVTDIDISSAYPFHQKDLPNWGNGDWVKVTEDEIKEDDKFGYMYCNFDYPLIPYRDNGLHTFEEYHGNSKNGVEVSFPNMRKLFPDGERVVAPITLIEYRFLKEFNYLIKCYGGFVWRRVKDRNMPDPFSWMQEVYKLKQDTKKKYGKKDYRYSLTKIPLNSAYGITAQKARKGKYGRFTNYFYASYITAATRMQICRMLEVVGYDRYITIATDGILLEGHIKLPPEYTQGGLGSWDVDYWDSALILGNGVYQLWRDKLLNPTDDHFKTAVRGCLSFKGNLVELLEEHKDESEIVPFNKSRPITMYQAVKWHRYTKEDMNVFTLMERKISCYGDTTKHWNGINTFGDLLDGKFTGKRYTIDEIEHE